MTRPDPRVEPDEPPDTLREAEAPSTIAFAGNAVTAQLGGCKR